MGNEPNNTEKLIGDLIAFIEKERELFGDFSAAPLTTTGDKQEKEQTSDPAETKETETAPDAGVQEPPQQKKKKPPSTTTQNSGTMIDSQEALFENDPDREIYYEIGKCNSLEELRELCLKADVLKTDLEGTQLVFGVGNPEADLMLIGEAPGAEEDKQGEPFVGAAGQLLNKILEAINFKREDVYIANILKHRPPNNRNPLPEERKRSLPFLLRQIDLIEPKLILSLGKVSAQTLLDNDNSLSSMRGKFHPFRGKYELMATYHPAALLRHQGWKRPTWEDVQLLRKRYDELGGKP